VHLLVFQLRVVLESSSDGYPVSNEDALPGDGSYQESCNRLYTILRAFEGCVSCVFDLVLVSTHTHTHIHTYVCWSSFRFIVCHACVCGSFCVCVENYVDCGLFGRTYG
jgi:hypothetical protein